MSFGGTPRCERCGGAVYHAEQALGPGRKIYHKLCLKCNSCGKRLDPGGLVQHDEQPYCQRCHTNLFGTRDLRQANLYRDAPAVPAPPAPVPEEPAFSSPSRRDANGAPAPRAVPPPQEYYVPPDLSGASESASSSAPALSAAPPPPLPQRPRTPEQITRVNFRSVRPIPAGVSASGRTDSPRSKVGERPGFEDRCPACEKRVYAAEQVQAIGKKWHRACLRCTSCRSTIDPSRVSDRDGQPWCKNCYAREHGPGGIAGKR